MAIGAIELSMISRSQDYTTVKHNEDNKAFIDQTNIGQQSQKTNEQKAKSVNEGDDARWNNGQFDARQKGSNEYAGDGGSRRRQKESTDRVVVKGRDSFDMKV